MKHLVPRALAACFLFLALLCSSLQAAEFEQQTFPLERNGVALHLERMTMHKVTPERQILLVHGLTYSSHEFDVDYADYSLARFLASEGYAVWRLDVAGYGESGQVQDGFMPNSDYAAEDIASAVEVILRESGEKQIDVLGWSWGTVTSSRYVAKHPDQVRKLVLYAPILMGLGEAEVKVPFNTNTWVHAADDFQKTPSGEIDYSITDPAIVATYVSNCWRYDKESSPNGGRRDLLVSKDTRLIAFGSLKVPTLVLCGDRDPYLDLDAIRHDMSLLPKGSSLEIIPGAAHAMMMEKPHYHDFRARLMNFLK